MAGSHVPHPHQVLRHDPAGDVRLACELGVDAIGFVFARAQPASGARRRRRARCAHALAPLVDAVALFMDNAARRGARRRSTQVRPSLLQFHGGEDDAFCRRFGLPYLKAMPMGEGDAWRRGRAARALSAARPASLFDSHAPGAAGGSGSDFDWTPGGLTDRCCWPAA